MIDAAHRLAERAVEIGRQHVTERHCLRDAALLQLDLFRCVDVRRRFAPGVLDKPNPETLELIMKQAERRIMQLTLPV